MELGKNHQVVPYSHQPFTQQHQQSFYNTQIYHNNSNYPRPRIGFEHFVSPTPSPSLYSGYSNSMALQRYSLNRQVQNQTNSSNNVSYAASTSSGYVKKENPYYSVREQAQSSSASSQYSSPKTKTNDLINLDITDEATSFADILQTFDPLIARNEEASKSYYSDQDPFDYIYSGNSHCSGDPLYEAINRNERLATLREQGYTYYSSENEISPPPLPPRNS